MFTIFVTRDLKEQMKNIVKLMQNPKYDPVVGRLS